MGLFRKTKKEEIPPDETKTAESVQIKSPEEIQRDQVTNELEYLQGEVRSKTDHLNSISEKFVKVKEEYEHIVSELMLSKKELNEKKLELESINSQYEEKKSSLNELERADRDLAAVKSEYIKYKAESEELENKVKTLQASYEDNKRAHESAGQNIAKEKAQQEAVRKEIEEIRKEYESKKKEIEIARKELKFIEEQIANVGDRSTPKNVVAAASSVVASMNSKLLATQKELETLKIALQRERADHAETKKKLDDLSQV